MEKLGALCKNGGKVGRRHKEIIAPIWGIRGRGKKTGSEINRNRFLPFISRPSREISFLSFFKWCLRILLLRLQRLLLVQLRLQRLLLMQTTTASSYAAPTTTAAPTTASPTTASATPTPPPPFSLLQSSKFGWRSLNFPKLFVQFNLFLHL